MTDVKRGTKPDAEVEFDGKRWMKAGNRWYYWHRQNWQTSPQSFDVFMDAVAENAKLRERVAELEQTNTNNVAIHEQQLNDLRTDIGKLADELMDQAKLNDVGAARYQKRRDFDNASDCNFKAAICREHAAKTRKLLEASNGRD